MNIPCENCGCDIAICKGCDFYNDQYMDLSEVIDILTEIEWDLADCIDGGEGSEEFEQGVNIAREQAVDIVKKKIDEIKEKKNDKD